MDIVWKGSGLDRRVAGASRPLFIGSHAAIEEPIIGLRERLAIQPYIHASYATPSDDILRDVEIVYVYEIEDDRRFLQLAECCSYQRKHGGIKSIYAVLRDLDVERAERVESVGAQFRVRG